MAPRTYIAIDLKSFYASVECVSRGLDPLTTNLVVADSSRTEGTICLAVSPSLKAYGTGGRPRLFEVVSLVKKINAARIVRAPGRRFRDSSADDTLVRSDPSLSLGYIVATPRMAEYLRISGVIYGVYLKYIAPEDIHVYSVDEVFMDVTDYLRAYSCDAHTLAMRIIRDVLATTGITATAGIGTNLYLAKVAMDILAKHTEPDKDGVRIASLDEMSYRRLLWSHEPLRDFWRVGRGYAARLEAAGIHTMGDIARLSLNPAWESWFYKSFGVNAELLIDHAWGWEPCLMSDIKAYKPSSNSIGSAQVLPGAYDFAKARIIAVEMADQLSLNLLERGLVTDQVVLDVGFDRRTARSAHGSANLPRMSSSETLIRDAVSGIFDRVVDPSLQVRYVGVSASRVVREEELEGVQLSLFDDSQDDGAERRRQETVLAIKKKFGKNAILKGVDFEEGATAMERNKQIGGHKA